MSRWWSFLVAVSLVSGAQAQKASPVWPNDIVLKAQWSGKEPDAKQPTAIAVPPGTPGCTAGRVLVSGGYWTQDPKEKFAMDGTPLQTPILLASDLGSTGAAQKIELPRVPNGHAVTDDNHLLRLADGTLVVLWNIAVNTPSRTNDRMWQEVLTRAGGWRGAFAMWTAKDGCGKEWNEPQVLLDSLATKIDGQVGPCGGPQTDRAWIGGYTSLFATADPWDASKIYLVGRCEASQGFYRTFMSTVSREDAQWKGSEMRSIKARPPVALTVAPKTERRERVYAVSCGVEHKVPRTKLGWLDYGKIFGGPVNAGRGCESVEGLSFFPAGTSQAISRVTSDRHTDLLRLVHPAVTEGRQVAVASLIRVAHVGSVKQERHQIIDAGDRRNIVGATFIEADGKDDGALLYWLEQAPGNKVTAKGMFFRGDTASKPVTLSLKQGKATASTLEADHVLGNLMRGAFYREGDQPRYLAVWPQRDADGTIRVHYNVYAPAAPKVISAGTLP